ncbi:substrate-binding domain-containing protein [Marinobacter persicus]|jgi:simple sugar transport system substrate-binding protein/ribose transport system substrate-binding protein|uniref:Monosaccharide ABC transporter substrate-binding protein (CUT2 family) n=1 Tax=Marinobacter persicus TaxID=930118 RepID=A0A2S6G9U1_9GAMM|nr:substrate-binding domain-containing protein [Marinobacter persicus]KXS52984.1 MAG: sugar ABC transporter periplasmic protein [Marinobacter sp. T13-3]PPK53202.1 monosaccharide ABC transporter substrate-binding protein (CUT2 family) [Marinobacter persicus]PPK56039.1 monosaccharide ABC transporter substrate-binding protein (CUT2 family) [Marinobacter persicus]PPK59634.1 monosaccharide ABC transporter substrate-binding protein (CUT2 family) [Marinobacter persicus]
MKAIRASRFSFVFPLFVVLLFVSKVHGAEKHLAYLVPDARIPFWNIMADGIRHEAAELDYRISVYSAENQAKKELEFTARAIREEVDGIILSPTNSSAAVTVLKLAEQAGIPMVISDIGADSDNYVSYIQSNNYQGAYDLGEMLALKMEDKGWSNGTVGIIAIPQKRDNGKARTRGFLNALEEQGIGSAGIFQQSDFSYRETYDFTRKLIARHADLRAIWLQGSNRYQAALDAMADAGKADQLLLICFDAEPEFLDMIAGGELVGAGMQQPFLMGEKAVDTMDLHLHGRKVKKVQQVDVLPVSGRNLDQWLPLIMRNVLGHGMESQ